MLKPVFRLFCLIALTSALHPCRVQQTSVEPEKEVIIVDLFARSRVVPPPCVEYLRGTSLGVRSSDLFLVYEDVPVGGVMTRQKVGKLRVNDVQNPSVAKCKITKGEAEIARAFSAGRG